MKSVILAIIALSLGLSSVSLAEEVSPSDSAMVEMLQETVTFDCPAYQVKAVQRVEDFYNAGKRDSLRLVVDFMMRHCPSYGFAKLDTLLAVETGETFDDWCDTLLVAGMPLDVFEHGGLYAFPGVQLDYQAIVAFGGFLMGFAEHLLPNVRHGSMAEVIVKVYLGEIDDVWLALRRGEYDGSCLQDYYNAHVAGIFKSRYNFRTHVAGNLGIWTPLSSHNVLHTKLEFGAQVGLRSNRFGVDMTGLLRVLKEPSQYQVIRNGALENTSHFVGGLVGIDLTYEAVRFYRSSFEVFVGAAYDGFQAIRDGSNGKSINSFNGNVGGSFRFFYNKKQTQFFGLQVRHNFVSYDGGGSDLSGNTLSLNLIYGIMINPDVVSRLDRLKYFSD